ncbi:hypothetical protein [Picosynechococcus sp. PCC 7003]|uniref:hypothetical protein n=1 Tax=Picosynechococcus sp. PCC 7003 TaxID=374981 RepID=UPI0012EDA070|nr:hypothetical protein [Picosynechococcus sp. PCC 7003]
MDLFGVATLKKLSVDPHPGNPQHRVTKIETPSHCRTNFETLEYRSSPEAIAS